MDLSLTGTGYCLYLNPIKSKAFPISVPDMGVIDTNKLEGLERMDHILNKIMDTIEDHPVDDCPNSTLVILEDFSFASKGASLFQIAGLGYLVRYRLWRQGIDFILVPPTVLKKFVTGAGNSDKSIMLKEIYKRWGTDINDDNIGDAYGLMRIGQAILGWDEDLTQFQKDALKQLEKK